MVNEAQRLDLMDPSWDLIRHMFERTLRSSAWRETGLWALERLEAHLGRYWARDVLTAEDGLKSRLALAPTHPQAFASLLELAVRLELTATLRGRPKLIKELRRDRRVSRLVHTEMILEVITVAGDLGVGGAAEVPAMRNPVDVVLEWNETRVPIEAMALLTDEEFRQIDDATTRLGDAVLRVSRQTGAQVTLDLKTVPSDLDAVQRLIETLAEEANGGDGRSGRSVEFGKVVVDIRGGFLPPTVSGPVISRDGWERALMRLLNKAQKDYSERSIWIRIDVFDGLWQFTPWSEMDLPSKLEVISYKVRGDLAHADSVAGIVVSSGAVRAAGIHTDELSTDATTGAIGLRRLLPMNRVRETMIIPIQSRLRDEAQLWLSIYDSEPEWLGNSLYRLGLPDAATILS